MIGSNANGVCQLFQRCLKMKFNCSYDELSDVSIVVPNPKNPNSHPKKQIERLAKIIEYQGQRHPIIVSKRTGFVVAGHGRLEAIKKLGWEKVAVNYQDFENEAQEYAFIVSDNAIAEWSELDLTSITEELNSIGPDFLSLDLLGVESIESLKDVFFEPGELGDQGLLDKKQLTKCPNCGEEFESAKYKA